MPVPKIIGARKVAPAVNKNCSVLQQNCVIFFFMVKKNKKKKLIFTRNKVIANTARKSKNTIK